jgi:hypothetical protein
MSDLRRNDNGPVVSGGHSRKQVRGKRGDAMQP